MAGAITIACAVWMVSRDLRAEAALGASARALSAGDWETAQRSLASLRHPWLLSAVQRRQAAELCFRLGLDREGHTLLFGQRFDPHDAADRHLRDLGVRCQLAAASVQRAERSATPEERRHWIRDARSHLPEAPDVLRRLVEADLACMVRSASPDAGVAFLQDYAQLRLHAPQLADRLKAQVAAAARSPEL